MTPAQFRAAIARLGLSQVKAGEWLGSSGRQGQRWANGEAKIPKAEAMLLSVMIWDDLSIDDVEHAMRKHPHAKKT